MHHANPTEVHKPHQGDMMYECSPGELLAKSAFMHNSDKGHRASKQCAALKGLRSVWEIHQRQGRGRGGLCWEWI